MTCTVQIGGRHASRAYPKTVVANAIHDRTLLSVEPKEALLFSSNVSTAPLDRRLITGSPFLTAAAHCSITTDDLLGDGARPQLLMEKDAERPTPVTGQPGFYDVPFTLQIDNPSDETVFNLVVTDDILTNLAGAGWSNVSWVIQLRYTN